LPVGGATAVVERGDLDAGVMGVDMFRSALDSDEYTGAFATAA